MKNDPKIGCLITGDVMRDAIHVAIAPVIANEKLEPGQDIGFVNEESQRVGITGSSIGIVDPYLLLPVHPPERFWMFLYPNTITSLRHVWTHPSFESQNAGQEESIKWLSSYAKDLGIDYETLLKAAKGWIEDGSVYCLWGDNDDRYLKLHDMWKHLMKVAPFDIPLEATDNEIFSCAC